MRKLLLALLLALLSAGSSVMAQEVLNPASYIVWWPGKSSNNTPADTAYEMERMVKTYRSEYILVWAGWADFEPKPNQFNFQTFDTIVAEARKWNIKVILEISADFYGGTGYLPYTYASAGEDLSWFWKKKIPNGNGTYREYGLYDPLVGGMRGPPTCGCNCPSGVNPAYGTDFCLITGKVGSGNNYLASTCDQKEKVPAGEILVNEHPDLIYNPFDTCWPGAASGNYNIHTPYPSFSSTAYRQELLDLWEAVAQHVKSNYQDDVWGYQIWHEPSYAHFRSLTEISGVQKFPEVDYSQPELTEYNKWRASQSKGAVNSIPNPPDADYVYFKKYNLAYLQKLIKNQIKSIQPGAKVGTNLFLAGINNPTEANKNGIDAKVLYDVLKPDFISEASLVSKSWSEAHYGNVTNDQLFSTIKSINTDKVPLMSASIDNYKEVITYGAQMYTGIEGHWQKMPNGLPDMPLIASWFSKWAEGQWNSPNVAVTNQKLAGGYQKDYGYKWIKTPSFVSMEIGNTYAFELVLANRGKLSWASSGANPFGMGAQWLNMEGKEVQADGYPVQPHPNYNPFNFRAWTPSAEIILPGELQNYKFKDIKPPAKPGGYQLKFDMVHEGKTWFGWTGQANPFVLNVTVINPSTALLPTISRVMGDANGDGRVDLTDQAIWKKEYVEGVGKSADFDGNGKVDMTDLGIWKTEYVE